MLCRWNEFEPITTHHYASEQSKAFPWNQVSSGKGRPAVVGRSRANGYIAYPTTLDKDISRAHAGGRVAVPSLQLGAFEPVNSPGMWWLSCTTVGKQCAPGMKNYLHASLLIRP